MDYYRRLDQAGENFHFERQWREQKGILEPNRWIPPRNGQWYKMTRYPESFQMKPYRTSVSTFFNELPYELVGPPELNIILQQWATSTGQAHSEKILSGPFKQEILNKAAGSMKTTYVMPHCEDRIKMTSERFLYDGMPFAVSISKTDYKPIRPYADIDFQNGPLVTVPHPRHVRFVRRTELKPGFPIDEVNSVYRKFNTYMTTSRSDYRNPAADFKNLGMFSCC